MDIGVSFQRLLLGDNSPVSPTYTDNQLLSSQTLGPPPTLPADVVLTGVITFLRFPSESSIDLADRTMDDVRNMDAVRDMDTLAE